MNIMKLNLEDLFLYIFALKTVVSISELKASYA